MILTTNVRKAYLELFIPIQLTAALTWATKAVIVGYRHTGSPAAHDQESNHRTLALDCNPEVKGKGTHLDCLQENTTELLMCLCTNLAAYT